MNKSSIRVLLFVLISFFSRNLSLAQSKIPKVLFVIVDGISADSKEKIPTPNLDKIAQKSGYTRAHVGGEKGTYSQTPTISAVGYNSLLTGTWVNKHNVWDNNIKDPNYHYWTVFRFLKEQYPAKRTAIFSSWIDNRTKLLGDGLPQTNQLKVDYFFDGFELDTLHFPHDKEKAYMHKIDEKVVAEAADYIKESAPDLSWVYLEYTDDMGHRYGDSEQFHKAIGMMDDQMGKLWEAVQYREKKFKEDWQVFITTDHGRDAETGKGHGGQSDRERSTWMVTNARNLNSNFTSNPGVVAIMPTIARHLNLTFPKDQAFEIDGVPLTGKLSIQTMNVKKTGNEIKVSWKGGEQDGKIKIWLTTTNNFEKGGQDNYLLMDEVAVASEQAVINVANLPAGFYKIVLEGKYNSTNRWIVE